MNTQFKKGQIPWNKGRPMSPESKEKLRASLDKIIPSKKKVAYWKGKKLSLETRRKMSEIRKGDLHWNWKGGGGKTAQKIIRMSFEYRNWRKMVFERDNYTCVLCSKSSCYLEADHIKRFAEYPQLRFDIANGRTLCLSCHRKTETWGNKKLKVGMDT